MKLLFKLVSFSIVLGGCGQVTGSRIKDSHGHGHGNPAAGEALLRDSDATKFMDALLEAGVKADQKLGDKLALRVDRIDCSLPVIPDAKPICTISGYQDEKLNLRDEAADFVYQTILRYGGSINSKGVVGAEGVVSANKILCSRTQDLQPITNCLFFTGAPLD